MDEAKKRDEPADWQMNLKPMTDEELWTLLSEYQGSLFATAKKLEFTYTIRGGEMFVDRRSKSITKATVREAYHKLLEDTEHRISGPKALNCFGAPYIWAVFASLGIVKQGIPGRKGRKKKSDQE